MLTKSLLWQYYAQLTEQDRKVLQKAVRSPIFNTRVELLRLLEFLELHADNGQIPAKSAKKHSPKAPTKEMAWEYLHSQATQVKHEKAKEPPPYHDGKLRHLMAYLLELIREVLAWQDWRNQPHNLEIHLCRSLKKYNQDQLFDREYQTTQAQLEATDERSTMYFTQKYQLEMEQWEMFRQTQRTGEGNLFTLNQTFSVLVAITTLRQACATLAQQTFGDNQGILPYLNETLRLIEAGNFSGSPAVDIYHLCYLTIVEPENETVLPALKSALIDQIHIFQISELRDIFILATNYCIKRLNAGDKQYIREAFELYREGLKHNVFLENGYLSRFTYRNILNLALGLSEWTWSYEYLHSYAQYLQPKERENIFRYNLATYYFRQPDHDKALELLRHVETKEILYHFDSRRMMLRIYYDRQEFQALDSLLESFTTYLRRHSDASYHHKMYSNLVRYMKRLITLTPHDTPAREKLKSDITRAQHLAERDWLLSLLGS